MVCQSIRFDSIRFGNNKRKSPFRFVESELGEIGNRPATTRNEEPHLTISHQRIISGC